MKNQLFILVFFFLCSSFGFGQNEKIDSLKATLLKPSIQDSTKVSLYLNLAKQYYKISVDTMGHYSALARRLSKLSYDYKLGRALNLTGLYHSDKGDIDSARYYFNKVIDWGEVKKDTSLLILGNMNMAGTFHGKEGYDESIRYNLKAIEFVKNDKYRLGEIEYNLAIKYSVVGYDSLALKYLKLATKNGEESGHDLLLASSLPNLAAFLLEDNKFEEAKVYIDKSYELCKKLKSPRVCYSYYIRIGTYYDMTGEFDKAEKYYKDALVSVMSLDNIHEIKFTYVSLGQHYVLANNPKQAIINLEKFSLLNKDSPDRDLEVWAYEYWAKAEKMLGNYENSMQYLEKYIAVKDSLNIKNNNTYIANAEAKYQSEKKDKELTEQKLALTESKSKTRTMNIMIVSLLLGSILLWFSFRQRQKRMQQQLVAIEREQEVRTLESLMEGEEKERLRIAKELHDGVNGDLAAIKFKLTSLLETNNQVINEAVAMIDTSSEQVRAISHNLVPPSLRDFNLLEAVATYCENMNAIHEPEISFQHFGNEIVLDKKQEANLFRIVQELVTNSIKHAEAKEVHVQLSNVEDNLQLTVEDDGKGFDANALENDGIGMQNVKSRVEYLGGVMDIKSDAKGTSFTITITDKSEKA